MKLIVDRNVIETTLVALEACQGDIYAPHQAMRQVNVAVKQLQDLLQDNPEPSICVDCSVEILSQIIYPLVINDEYYGVLCNECLSKKLNSNTTLITKILI